MTELVVLPHETLCPEGKTLTVAEGTLLCDALLDNGIDIEHACDRSCACTTCHVVIREGYSALVDAEEREEDLLDRAWGLEATSRLSCQVRAVGAKIVIAIPKYTVNHAREHN